LLLLSVLILEILPFKVIPESEGKPTPGKIENQKTFVVHVHTFFSYDSLGKPEELEREAEKLNIDRVYITDHDNDNLRFFLKENTRLRSGVEYQDARYGRLLVLDRRWKVIAHPNNDKKPLYRWKGVYERDFFYELVDFKDLLYSLSWFIKLYFFLRSVLLYPFLKHRVGCFAIKFLPLEDWIRTYLKRTGGELKILGGLDHHVKFSFWEKPKKFFSVPPYSVSFYAIQNRTFGGCTDIEEALEGGKFYISFCGSVIELENGKILTEDRKVFFQFFTEDGKSRFSLGGEIREGEKIAVVYKYKFKIGRIYFGVIPAAVVRL